MEFFADTSIRPSDLPIVARESWHRAAWSEEQRELASLVGVRQLTAEDIDPAVFKAIYGDSQSFNLTR